MNPTNSTWLIWHNFICSRTGRVSSAVSNFTKHNQCSKVLRNQWTWVNHRHRFWTRPKQRNRHTEFSKYASLHGNEKKAALYDHLCNLFVFCFLTRARRIAFLLRIPCVSDTTLHSVSFLYYINHGGHFRHRWMDRLCRVLQLFLSCFSRGTENVEAIRLEGPYVNAQHIQRYG